MMRDEVDAKWMALRSRFIARLPERIADIELLRAGCASAGPQAALKTLFHIVHNLNGSGATFGFDELARAARKAENCIEIAMKNAPTLDDALADTTAAHMHNELRQLTAVAASIVAKSSHGDPS